MRRIASIAGGLALLTGLLVSCPRLATAQSPLTVKVGVPAVYPIYSIFFAAKELGYYAAQGLDVDIVTFRGGPASQEALTAGAIDIISQPPHAVALALDHGVKEHIVAFYAPPRPAGWYIATPAASPIKSTADLNGKNVGVTQKGSLAELYVGVDRDV